MLEVPKALDTLTVIILKDITMDNQQKTDAAYASYLACMLDGEGYVGLIPLRNKNKRTSLAPRISLNNSDLRILNNVKAALVHFNIPFHVYEHTSNKCFDIRIKRLTGVKSFLEVVMDSPLLGKRQECSLLYKFVCGRFGVDGRPLPQKNHPHTPEDFKIAEEIKAIRTSQRAYVKQLSAEDVLRATNESCG